MLRVVTESHAEERWCAVVFPSPHEGGSHALRQNAFEPLAPLSGSFAHEYLNYCLKVGVKYREFITHEKRGQVKRCLMSFPDS